MLGEADTKFEKMAIHDKLYSFLKELFYLKKYEKKKNEQKADEPQTVDDDADAQVRKIRDSHQKLLNHLD